MTSIARLITLALVVATAAASADQATRVTGTITYRERIALTPEAIVEITIEDVSLAGARPVVVATTMMERPGQVPIAFSLPFDPRGIDATRRYAVHARITDQGVLLFDTTDTLLVLTQGHGRVANLVLTRVGTAKPAPTPASIPPAAPPLPADPLTNLPATFTGTLPCADCEGIRYHLNLIGDDAFFLRMTYAGRPGDPVDDMGSWALSSDRRMLVLQGRGAPVYFGAPAPGVLRKLDADGQPIESRLPYELKRASVYQPVDVRLPMRGAYSYLADAALFVECTTGQRWPVAAEAAAREVEDGYVKVRPAPGAAVLMEADALLTARPSMEGARMQPTLVIQKVSRWVPREGCAARFTSAPLTTTSWRLTHLGAAAVPKLTDPRREPGLTFDAGADTFSGSSGCNRLIGRYTIDNAAMTLTAAGSLMACRDKAETEAAFTAALRSTRAYRVTGRVLELLNDKGARVARFEARVASGITVR